ncbi:MAG: CDGSH iron-sulfur domain-containing protein [Geodermatophilaceae bacterium]|nr:CDGSH iron-sulfur domain-containing protein [Geodermatophilaceae bacterium]
MARVTITGDGPILIRGPVEIELADGRRVSSRRAVTALCVCRRSRRQPFCDTSHRERVRGQEADRGGDRADGSR